ncbi:MAG TPA: hypothetical protein VGC76_13935 [Pyrinomonadaceae bacterium]|jgi:hypothetical protein
MSDNLISIQFSDIDLRDINQAIQVLQTKFAPYLIALSTEDKQSLPKAKDKSVPFIQKSASYMQTNPEFTPPFLNKPEFDKDYGAFNAIYGFLRLLAPITSNLEDTAFLCSAEAYRASLNYYNSVQRAAAMNVPGAKAIYDDLKTYFDAQRAKPQKPATPATPTV